MQHITWKDIAASLVQQTDFTEHYSPLYHALYHWLATIAAARRDDQTLDRIGQAVVETIETAWAERPLAGGLEASLLIPAAIHAAVLAEDESAATLRPFYATVGGNFDPAQDQQAFGDALGDLFLARGEVLTWYLQEARVQTNEISRSVGWLWLAKVLQTWEVDPLNITLVELGCSGGLNLSADQQAWHWNIAGEDYHWQTEPYVMRQTIHPAEAHDLDWQQVVDSSAVTPPNIVNRIGFDRNPLNLYDDLHVLMLKACLWGDQPERVQRFERAVAGYKRMVEQGTEPRYYQGDIKEAAALLPRLIPPDAPRPHLLLVFNTAVTVYMGDTDYDVLRTNLMHSFQTLPEGIRGLWVEMEGPRYNEQVERRQHFQLRVRLPFMGGVSSLYLGELEAHPTNLYLRSGWSSLRELLYWQNS